MNDHGLREWKRHLLTSPDDAFFDLMRNYLGDIKTPFSKHFLIDKLTALLRKNETLDRIVGLMDVRDAELVSVIHLLNEPTIERLFTVLKKDAKLFELHHHLLNLEERLIIFRDQNSGKIKINPLLEKVLEDKVIHSAYVFTFDTRYDPQESSTAPPWLNETLLISVLSFILANPMMLKADGSFKKKILTDIKRRFPGMSGSNAVESRFRLVLGTLVTLELIEIDDRGVRPSFNRWISFSELPLDDRRSYLWAAAWKYTCAQSPLRLAESAAIAKALSKILPADVALSVEAMKRMILLVSDRVDSEDEIDGFISVLVELNVLETHGNTFIARNPVAEPQGKPENALIVQPNFELSLEPGADLEDSIIVGIAADIQKCDVVSRFELNKLSFCRALSLGLGANDIAERLQKLCGRPLAQNVTFAFSSWEKQYRSIRLIEGCILRVDEDRRHLVEHSKLLQPFIEETIGTGIYLLSTVDIAGISKALRESGIDPVPELESRIDSASSGDCGSSFERIHTGQIVTVPDFTKSISHPVSEIPSGGDLRKEFEEYVRRADLPPAGKEFLMGRIEKKLILTTRQLKIVRSSREKIEAKGFDYLGKVRLIQQALKGEWDLLEILIRKSDGTPQKLIVKPLELHDRGGDLELVCNEIPGEKKRTVKVKRIGFLRKMKSALFTQQD